MPEQNPTATITELKPMQTWRSSKGALPRQIQEIRAASVGDYGTPMGTILIQWATNAGRWGTCTQASFRSWIRREKAYLA